MDKKNRSNYEKKLALREQGMTYREIANELGISYQAVAQSLAQDNPKRFQFVKESSCKYPNIRKWMNENKISMKKFVVLMGYVQNANQQTRIKEYLTRCDIPKKVIDKILAVTGMTYEKAFYLEDGAKMGVDNNVV